jgi:hypothetical protein
MSIASMTKKNAPGGDGVSPLRHVYVEFAGDSSYLTGGTRGIQALVRAACGNYGLQVRGFLMGDCGVYDARMVQERGYVDNADTFAVADQDGLTVFVSVDGAAYQTLTFAGATTTAAHIVTRVNATLTGVLAFEIGGTLRIMSTKQGAGSSVEIVTGGTSILTWDDSVDGSEDPMLLVRGANNVEQTLAANLSGQTFRGTFLCE